MFWRRRKSLAPARNRTPDRNMAVYTILQALTFWNTNLWNTGHTCGTCFFFFFSCFVCLFLPLSPHGTTAPSGPGPPHHRGFTITLRHTTLSRTPLDEWSAQCRDLYLTTHNTHNRQISRPLAEFKPAIPAS